MKHQTSIYSIFICCETFFQVNRDYSEFGIIRSSKVYVAHVRLERYSSETTEPASKFIPQNIYNKFLIERIFAR